MAMRAIRTSSIPSLAIRRTAAPRMRSRAPRRPAEAAGASSAFETLIGPEHGRQVLPDPVGEPGHPSLTMRERPASITAGVKALLDVGHEVDVLVHGDRIDAPVQPLDESRPGAS